MDKIYNVGIDIGSTTMKMAVLDRNGDLSFSAYQRHNADIRATALELVRQLYNKLGDCALKIVVTGSVGMGYAKRNHFAFVQEVVAAAEMIKQRYPEVGTFIDMGGEDSKMIFFEKGKVPDIRMNGSCAGGTGAFIDQTAMLFHVETKELNVLAAQAENIYPIASRCGVFSKTDIQNLMSRNISRADIAASVFNAVAMQVVASLARGMDITPKVFFCGGPFAFLPELQKHFRRVLELSEEDCILPENAQLIPASGCALLADTQSNGIIKIGDLLQVFEDKREQIPHFDNRLPALFVSQEDYNHWLQTENIYHVPRAEIKDEVPTYYYLGVDSGSTTTKLVLLDEQARIVYTDYQRNEGDSFKVFCDMLQSLYKHVAHPENIMIKGSAVTGYGENLIKAAFDFNHGIVETMAHFFAAKQVDPTVSFVLDIGGQDMKAIFVDNGSIRRMEINEACSSGCGSFIETFANMMSYPVAEFAKISCFAAHPCDLGTRCTVFMNSKVKQAMQEGASVEDIAAGFSYSVVKNCLFKVLKLNDIKELGKKIVVQGGTFRNHSILRALEKMTGCSVSFSDIPELMGAYGAALYASQIRNEEPVSLCNLISSDKYESEFEICPGCENHCTVKLFHFQNGNTFFSGNNCEKIYSNTASAQRKGVNMFAEKNKLLFKKVKRQLPADAPSIGIPRALGIYENYPFWATLFTECGWRVVLSSASGNKLYESGLRSIMADNICFPAKLMHGHIHNLTAKKVDRIFYPYVVYERKEDENSRNSYNCPIVAGYSDVIRSSMNPEVRSGISFDAPVITFNNPQLLEKSCCAYLHSLGVSTAVAKRAIAAAWKAQNDYLDALTQRGTEILNQAICENRMVILLAARPYHIDPLIEHKISHAIADMGIDVITENVAAVAGADVYNELNAMTQWSYPNRIFKAAYFVGQHAYRNLHFVQLTSFGCGPDAFILDEVKSILRRFHKNHTILKIDDVNNIGSLRLRVRSLVESVTSKEQEDANKGTVCEARLPYVTTRTFTKEEKRRTLLAPYFAEGYSEFFPSIFKVAGYHLITLPTGNQEAAEMGLKYANNEVCYPATIVVGSIMNALLSGKYNPDEVAIVMTQTGGQCRASNYYSLIKNALVSSNLEQIPVVSLALSSSVSADQPGFTIPWRKVLNITVHTILYADCLSKLYHASVVREKEKGAALRLKNHYTEKAFPMIESNDSKGLMKLLRSAVAEFTSAVDVDKRVPVIGVVGEIYVKYNGFSNKFVINWLEEHGVEVVPPALIGFLTTGFANNHINRKLHIKEVKFPQWLNDTVYHLIFRKIKQFNRICAPFPFYRPLTSIFDDAKLAEKVVNLAGDFGEGWFLPGEICHLAESGVQNVVSLQPFGCIANHIISKGIEKKLKQLYQHLNLLFLDFDSGTSEANVYNRLHFMVENCKKTIPTNH